LENRATLVAVREELSDETEYPSQIYGVVTNVPSAAAWTRNWGGNLVEVALVGDVLRLVGKETRTFDTSELETALTFTSEQLDALPEAPPSVGLTRRSIGGSRSSS